MNLFSKIFAAAVLPALILVSCTKDTPAPSKNPADGLTGKARVADAWTGAGIKATLWQDTLFFTGYNKFYLTLTDSATGAPVQDAHIQVTTLMTMGNMMMSGPVEQPAYAGNLYAGAAVFTMAGGSMGQWSIRADVQDPAASRAGAAVFRVDVANRAYNPVILTQGTDNRNYVITVLQPLKPQMGMNDLEVLVSREADSMQYVPVDDVQMQVTPEMPSMGGMTTPNNENPVSVGNGHYKGKINLNMTGDWRLDFKIMQGGSTLIDNAYTDFIF